MGDSPTLPEVILNWRGKSAESRLLEGFGGGHESLGGGDGSKGKRADGEAKDPKAIAFGSSLVLLMSALVVVVDRFAATGRGVHDPDRRRDPRSRQSPDRVVPGPDRSHTERGEQWAFGQLFETSVNGEVYGQPLLDDNQLLVNTQNDYAYGLDPVPARSSGAGNSGHRFRRAPSDAATRTPTASNRPRWSTSRPTPSTWWTSSSSPAPQGQWPSTCTP